jgi:(4S)-4-hydroxy-5-phosphonooxypentane-2,3-dione isomerase
MLAVVVSVRVKPDRRDEFLKAIEEDSRGSREDEPGCLRFDVLQDASDPNHFFFYEVYRDEAALKAHREAPHYQVWVAVRDGGALEGEPQITRCASVFPTDAQWK